MSKRLWTMIAATIVWAVIAEFTLYGSLNHWHVNPWLAANAQVISAFGGVVIGSAWLYIVAEGIGL